MRSRVIAACAGMLLLAACDGGTPAPPGPTTPTTATTSTSPTAEPTPTIARRAWHLSLEALTQPVYVDGVAVLFTHSARRLSLVAVDPATGRRLWSRPATTSAVSVEEPLEVAVVGGDVAYFRPTSSGGASARLVVADAHTGRDKVSSPVEAFSTPIEPCDDPVTRLCGTARPYFDTAAERYSFVVATGRFGPAAGEQPPVSSRPVGPGGLIDLGIRAPERVGVFRDNRLLWSMPVVAYFPDGSTTDAGWKFMLEGDRYIGTLDQSFPLDGDVDMGDVATASFEAATGKSAWSVRGSSLNCRGTVVLPLGLPVRCHYWGHAIVTAGVVDFSDVHTSFEGFEPDSGKRTWDFDLGKGVGFLRGVRVPPLAGATALLVGRAPDQVLLDLASGETTTPLVAGVYLCPTLSTFDSDRGPLTGEPLLDTCSADRTPVEAAPSVALLTRLHQTLERPGDDLVLVAGADGLTGYRLTTR